jgi:hypothetical protein
LNEYEVKAQAAGMAISLGDSVRSSYNPTVRENIDNRIKAAVAQVERLQTVRSQMEKSGLLDIPIGDLQEAMRF